jgi:hypothetical protein
VLPFGWVTWASIAVGLLLALWYSVACINGTAERRLVKHGYEPGTLELALHERYLRENEDRIVRYMDTYRNGAVRVASIAARPAPPLRRAMRQGTRRPAERNAAAMSAAPPGDRVAVACAPRRPGLSAACRCRCRAWHLARPDGTGRGMLSGGTAPSSSAYRCGAQTASRGSTDSGSRVHCSTVGVANCSANRSTAATYNPDAMLKMLGRWCEAAGVPCPARIPHVRLMNQCGRRPSSGPSPPSRRSCPRWPRAHARGRGGACRNTTRSRWRSPSCRVYD